MIASLKEELNTVRTLANIVRLAVEHLAAYETKINENDDGYNDPSTLAGYCARSAALMSFALTRAGIDHKIAGGNGHFFIKWRGRIVDVTATQFLESLGKTVICTRTTLKRKVGFCLFDRWNEFESFSNVKELSDYQIITSWPECQCQRKYDIKFLTDLKEYKDYFDEIQK